MRPMSNPVNILRQIAKKNPAWRSDPRWIKAMGRMRRLLRKFKKERVARRLTGTEAKAVTERSLHGRENEYA